MEPRLQPSAPNTPAMMTCIAGLPAPKPNRVILPWKARYPAKGMMTSEGSGMQALSMAMSSITPKGPMAPMTMSIQAMMGARIFESMLVIQSLVRKKISGTANVANER